MKLIIVFFIAVFTPGVLSAQKIAVIEKNKFHLWGSDNKLGSNDYKIYIRELFYKSGPHWIGFDSDAEMKRHTASSDKCQVYIRNVQ